MEHVNNENKLLALVEASTEFKKKAAELGLVKLKDVLTIELNKLKAKPQFTYMWYTELLRVLKQENLLDQFQSRL